MKAFLNPSGQIILNASGQVMIGDSCCCGCPTDCSSCKTTFTCSVEGVPSPFDCYNGTTITLTKTACGWSGLGPGKSFPTDTCTCTAGYILGPVVTIICNQESGGDWDWLLTFSSSMNCTSPDSFQSSWAGFFGVNENCPPTGAVPCPGQFGTTGTLILTLS